MRFRVASDPRCLVVQSFKRLGKRRRQRRRRKSQMKRSQGTGLYYEREAAVLKYR